MEYRQGESHYNFSYRECREKYEEIIRMSDEEFMDNLVSILHFSCFILWFKEFSIEVLSDEGLIHQLIHLLDIEENTLPELHEIRKLFNHCCKLA